MNLPTGMVTFLFTDVEGSTRLWDAYPDDMRTALALHDEVVIETVTNHGGSVVKHTGDGMFLAFPSAPGAVACAVETQRRLAAADWPIMVGSLGVRMAMHSANVTPTGSDYYSPDVNRAARIEAAAHGGQILLSGSTKALIGDRIPVGVELESLGEHLLRGLSEPEQIHQASVEGLRTTFPPLRTVSTINGRLPAFGTSFVGRAAEVEALSAMVTDPTRRVITLMGPGGIGKSRLAVEVAKAAAPALGAVAHFLPLESVTDPTHIVKALADSIDFVIDLHVSAQITEKIQVFDRLRSQPVVLVLDNLEQLPGAGELIAEMAAELPKVTIVATSRRRVGISAEQVVPVDGMTSAAEADGVALFADRAALAGAEVATTDPTVSHLVQLLGGMPLAIELAAAWSPLLSVEEITSEVQRDLDFLTSSASDVPERHRSVAAVFEQAWRRLEPELQDALAAMSVFVAPFTREAAAEVAGATLPILARLAGVSLLQRQAIEGTYSLHPLLREFLAGRLTDRDPVAERYARFHLDRLTRRVDRLLGGDQLAARDELAEELEHLRFALHWAIPRLPDAEMTGLVWAYGDFLFLHSWVAEAADMAALAETAIDAYGLEGALERKAYLVARALEAQTQSSFLPPDDVIALIAPVLDHTTDDDGLLRATALMVRGIIEAYRSEDAAALEWYVRAEEVTADYSPLFNAIFGSWKGWSQLQLGEAETARTTFQEALDRANEDRHEIGRAFLLSKLGAAATELGDHRLAVDLHLEGREIFVKAGDAGGQGYTLSRLSWTHYKMENWDLARRYGLEGLEQFETMNHRWGIAVSHGRIGLAEVGLGNVGEATRHFLETLRVAGEAGLPDQLHYGVIGIGLALAGDGRHAEAARLLAGSAAAEKNPYADFAAPALEEIRQGGQVDVDAIEETATTLELDELVAEARQLGAELSGPAYPRSGE